MDKSYNLTSDPIPKLIGRLAIPASVGFLFSTLFNVVDTYFAGLISTDALASLSISFPVFFLIIAVSSGTSHGATALIAAEIGANKWEEARRFSAQTLAFGLLLAGGVTLFGWIACPYLFRILGAEGAYLDLALSYMRIIFSGSIFFILFSTFNAPLMATGDTRSFSRMLILSSLLNVVFNPWFIFGGFGVPAMGFKGIAYATILVEAIGAAYLFRKVWRTGLLGAGCVSLLLPQWCCIRRIARNAFPAGMNLLMVGVGIFVVTYFVSGFGKEEVAAYGIAMRIEQFVLLPAIGFNMSTLAIAGQNFGAGLPGRIRETIQKSLKYSLFILAAGAPIVLFGAERLMGIFSAEAEVIRVGASYLRITMATFLAYVTVFVQVSALQGMQRPMYAVWIGLYRQLVAPLLLFYVITEIFGWGILGIWWGVFLITWSAALITSWHTRRVLTRMETAVSSTAAPAR